MVGTIKEGLYWERALGYTQGREGSKEVGPISLDSWSPDQWTGTLKQPTQAVHTNTTPWVSVISRNVLCPHSPQDPL